MQEATPVRPPSGRSLSARLLILTVFFVMLSEVMVYLPSIARFREDYLTGRLATAHVAILALEATPDNMVSDELAMELLKHAEAYAIAQRGPGPINRMLSLDKPPMSGVVIDLRESTVFGLIKEALMTLAQNKNRVMRVLGYSTKQPDALIETVIDEDPMRRAMYDYSVRILGLSIVIAVFTAMLVYFSLQWLMVAPMRRLTENMISFQEDPEDAARVVVPGARSDEIGMAQRVLAAMQTDLRAALGQKARLAALGAAVAKVNHDLRNLLTTATLRIESLAGSKDPEVNRVAPILFETIDRAVDLCRQTLDFARNQMLRVRRRRFKLAEIIDECFHILERETAYEASEKMTWENDVAESLEVNADREQLYRVFTNLGRNAFEAGADRICVQAAREGTTTAITFSDNGPGLPKAARDKLYEPFAGSTRAGGTGLGLAIVREIMRAHGGNVELLETGSQGTTFRLTLPEGGSKNLEKAA